MTSQLNTGQYEAARQRAAVIDRSDLGRIVLSGKDRASYLNGLLTNDIVSLKAGQGCYAAYLTPQGRMIADLWVQELGDVILLTLSRDVKDTVLAKLDQFVFSEDVQLGDVTNTFAHAAVVGPRAAAIVASIFGLEDPAALLALGERGSLRSQFAGGPAIVLRVTDTGEPGYDLLVGQDAAGLLREALRAGGAEVIDAATADVLRVEAGVPKFRRDMDEDTIPLEAGLESRAISFTKGCYVGQEIIIRVMHRGGGRVARKLVGLRPTAATSPDDNDTITADTPLFAGEKSIGRITSAAWSPRFEQWIAMGYVQRESAEPGTHVTIGQPGGAEAIVTTLPFN